MRVAAWTGFCVCIAIAWTGATAMFEAQPIARRVQWSPCEMKGCLWGGTGISCGRKIPSHHKKMFQDNLENYFNLAELSAGDNFHKSCLCTMPRMFGLGGTSGAKYNVETVAPVYSFDNMPAPSVYCLAATKLGDAPKVCRDPFIEDGKDKKFCQCFEVDHDNETDRPFTRLQTEMVNDYLDLGCTHFVGHQVAAEPKHEIDEVLDVTGKDVRVAILGDLHGDYERTVMALQMGGLLDKDEQWNENEKETILIQTGDIFDRGVDDMKLFLFFNHLQAGGAKIVRLNGNHEYNLLSGNWNYKNLWRCKNTPPDSRKRANCIGAISLSSCNGMAFKQLIKQPFVKLVRYGKDNDFKYIVVAHGGIPPKLADFTFFAGVSSMRSKQDRPAVMATLMNKYFRDLLLEQCEINAEYIRDFNPRVSTDQFDISVLKGRGRVDILPSGENRHKVTDVSESPFTFRGYFANQAIPTEVIDEDRPGCNEVLKAWTALGMIGNTVDESITYNVTVGLDDSDLMVVGHTVLEYGRGQTLSCRGRLLSVDTGLSRWMALPAELGGDRLMQYHNRPAIAFVHPSGEIEKRVAYFFNGLEEALESSVRANKYQTIASKFYYPTNTYEPSADTEICFYLSNRDGGEEANPHYWAFQECKEALDSEMMVVGTVEGKEAWLSEPLSKALESDDELRRSDERKDRLVSDILASMEDKERKGTEKVDTDKDRMELISDVLSDIDQENAKKDKLVRELFGDDEEGSDKRGVDEGGVDDGEDDRGNGAKEETMLSGH